MDVYDWTREKLEFLVKKLDSSAVDSVDMFSDEPATASSAPTTGSSIMDDEEQKWEYKESESGEIQGPFSSSEMARRQQNGKLSSSGLARKCGTASFNPPHGWIWPTGLRSLIQIANNRGQRSWKE
ncbi:unnamed protein product [Cylicostephanus goldi]|uniref:GYF domain-containing protein n=1 Tax=Cylicostephanus goldi TaxID=71465 RepID=A0A3P7NN85_CYLGO|nr:unnamed protein product [Cylicostephanus goldi]